MAIIPKLLTPTMFDDFEMDVVQEFKTDYSLEITDNPVETGFRIADHTIKRPTKLNLTVIFTPTNVTWDTRRGGAELSRLVDVENQFKLIRDTGEVGTVVTQNNIYENMMLNSASLVRDNKGYKITANLEFTEVTIVSTRTAVIPEEYASMASQAQAGQTDTDAGTAETSNITADTNTNGAGGAGATDTNTGTTETAETSNKSVAASLSDSLFG